jgi:hypothetical protein
MSALDMSWWFVLGLAGFNIALALFNLWVARKNLRAARNNNENAKTNLFISRGLTEQMERLSGRVGKP